MNQQINLYQPIFRKERKILSFGALVYACVMVAATLLAISGYGWWQAMALQREIGILEAQHKGQVAQLERITREVTKRVSADHTQNEILNLEKELQAERYILSVLDGKQLRNIKGFSAYFQSFSRQIIQGMWLTGFTVAKGGKTVEIRGSSLEPGLVPQFVQGLSNETRLKGTRFSVLQMLREEIEYQWVDFVLSAGDEEAGGAT